MEIIHKLGTNLIKKSVDNLDGKSLMLAHGGSYLWLGSAPASRYQGWFFGLNGEKMLKVVDDIRIENPGGFAAFENNFWNVKRISRTNRETFFLMGRDCLAYELEKPARIEFFLDIKEAYENPEFGRHYRVWRQGNLLFASYCLENNSAAPEIHIAVSGDFDEAEIKSEWVCRNYEFDRRRGSAPWERWVFRPAVLRASKLVFAVGFSQQEAAAAALDGWRDFEKIKRMKAEICGRAAPAQKFLIPGFSLKKEEKEMMMAEFCAQNSLIMLCANRGGRPGLRAGLPWFFQFWLRDEAVSLAGLERRGGDAWANIFWRQIKDLAAGNFDRQCADWPGWFFLCAEQYFQKGRFDIKQAAAIAAALGKEISFLLDNRTKNNLAISDSGKTWMDAIGRSGAAIEIQALRLNMYALAADLAENKKQKNRYLELEEQLAKTVRCLFFAGRRLADVYDPETDKVDFTVRPNLFLAAYIYPRLLSRNDWMVCFDYALPRLWFDWGGLSTVDKKDPRFCGQDLGENPLAYHNGDSWFWVNNIAAVVLARADRKKYKKYIDGIFQASKNDILWHGALGSASEISSALVYDPAGCVNQAWSNATFLELREELR